ncbi:MAG: tetratricopeptide repeat protein, partial [Gammaproteobacteria bacterium]
MLRFLLLCSALIAAPFAGADDSPLARARLLLDSGEAAAAYALLEPLEPDYAGDPAFDYLYGLAALDAGDPLRAVFALERVVDTEPGHGPARAELARAYLALGETDDARVEFEKVQEMDLPPEARQTIDRYMTGIELFHDRTRTRFRPWVLVGLGYDTNVNGATDAKSVIVPNISATQPALLGGTENSPLWTLGAGTRFTTPLDVERGLSLFGRVGLDHRLTVDEADFSSTAAAGALGLNLRRERHQLRLAAEADIVKIDGIGRVSG